MEADEAKQWGLVNEVVPAEKLMDRAREVATLLASGPPLVFAAIKEVVRETAHLPIHDAFDQITRKQLGTVKALYESDDVKEGARAFAEKREPNWRGQ